MINAPGTTLRFTKGLRNHEWLAVRIGHLNSLRRDYLRDAQSSSDARWKSVEKPWNGFLAASKVSLLRSDPRALTDKTVLITGAGGYIGSALAQSIAMMPIKKCLLLDIAEHGLYLLDPGFEEKFLKVARELIVGSVQDAALIHELFENYRPDIVFHAAAYKHVPLMEENPFSAVNSNILGTRILVEASSQFSAEQCILLSTDKAVDPVSIMGATKRIAELICFGKQGNTAMKVLRLCNVLGSSGSVAPLFHQQAREWRPVTVTHADATRYFLSIEETVQCFLALADASYASGLYIPPVSEPYKIEDLAKYLIQAGRTAERGSPIVYVGLRTGEKLHERMTSDRESPTPNEGALTRVDGPAIDRIALRSSMDEIQHAVNSRNLQQLLHAISSALPEYAISQELLSRES